MRLSEGPLLNKALFAFAGVLDACANSASASSGRVSSWPEHRASVYPAYDASHFTTMLEDVVGGNCLSLALASLTQSDVSGSKATLQLSRALTHVRNYPLVNNDMVEGLLQRHYLQRTSLLAAVAAASTASNGSATGAASRETLADYERKLHDLEGRLAREALEKRLLREDKDSVAALVAELKRKYTEVFDNELAVRTELLACEQEKLAVSKAFVAFELEATARAKELESDKFEVETKLVHAEEMVLAIQQDDVKKAVQIQDLVAKMHDVVREKAVLSEELALLQRHCQELDETHARDAKKNQQLSLELLVAVNQKQRAVQDAASAETQRQQLASQLDALTKSAECAQTEVASLKEQLVAAETQVEHLRRELTVKNLEAEARQLHAHKSQNDRATDAERLGRELDAVRSAAAAEKSALMLELERLRLDHAKCSSDKSELAHAWMSKAQENEALIVANERLVHECASQVDAFRLKLAFLASSLSTNEAVSNGVSATATAALSESASTTAPAGTSGLAALRELLASYQSHESQLRRQVAELRSKTHRLEQQLRARVIGDGSGNVTVEADATTTTMTKVPSERPGDAVAANALDGSSDRDEHAALLQDVEDARAQLAHEREQLSTALLRIADMERQNEKLTQTCDALKRQSETEHVREIRAMHDALLQQLNEVRGRLLQSSVAEGGRTANGGTKQLFANAVVAAQQQQAQVFAPAGPTTSQPSAPAPELAQLLQEKQQLEAKLAASTRQWTALVEQTERRSAALLTQNVMFEQENHDLRERVRVRPMLCLFCLLLLWIGEDTRWQSTHMTVATAWTHSHTDGRTHR